MEDHDRKSNRSGMIGDWTATGDFFGSILAGLLLGLLVDALAGTGPLVAVLGIVTGFSVGFWRMYDIARRSEKEELRRRSQRPTP